MSDRPLRQCSGVLLLVIAVLALGLVGFIPGIVGATAATPPPGISSDLDATPHPSIQPTGEHPSNTDNARSGGDRLAPAITQSGNITTVSTRAGVRSLDTGSVNVTLQPSNRITTPNTTVTFNVVVEGANDSVGSYEFVITSSDPNVATITSANLSGTTANESLTLVNFSDAGGSVEAAAGSPTISETGTVTIASIRVNATATGTANLQLSNVVVGTAVGTTYSISEQADATLTVANNTAPTVIGEPAQDLDSDGSFEDVNGDGTFDIVDVNAFFQNRQSSAVQDNVSHFDYNGDGDVNIVDVNLLFQNSLA